MDTAQWLDAKCGISRVTAREKVSYPSESLFTGIVRMNIKPNY